MPEKAPGFFTVCLTRGAYLTALHCLEHGEAALFEKLQHQVGSYCQRMIEAAEEIEVPEPVPFLVSSLRAWESCPSQRVCVLSFQIPALEQRPMFMTKNAQQKAGEVLQVAFLRFFKHCGQPQPPWVHKLATSLIWWY